MHIQVGSRFPGRYPSEGGKAIDMRGRVADGRWVGPTLIFHSPEGAEMAEVLSTRWNTFSLFYDPDLYPAGLPIFGFQGTRVTGPEFFEAPLIESPGNVVKWAAQVDFAPQKQVPNAVLLRGGDLQDMQAFNCMTFIVNDTSTDKVTQIRKIYIPGECFHFLHKVWSRDVNLHSDPTMYVKLMSRFSIRDILRNSTSWKIEDEGVVRCRIG